MIIKRILEELLKNETSPFADIWKRGLDTLDIQTTAGEIVNYDTALTLSAVFERHDCSPIASRHFLRHQVQKRRSRKTLQTFSSIHGQDESLSQQP